MAIPILRLRGEDGQMHTIPAIQGPAGKDGESPTILVESMLGSKTKYLVIQYPSGYENRVEINDGADGQNGQDGADGHTPVKGTDYWTEADKAELVQATIDALPVYDGEVE